MAASKLVQTGEASKHVGVHWAKLDRLRIKGLIPEVVPAGRYYFYPADQLANIRERLIKSGHINPARERPQICAEAADRHLTLAAN